MMPSQTRKQSTWKRWLGHRLFNLYLTEWYTTVPTFRWGFFNPNSQEVCTVIVVSFKLIFSLVCWLCLWNWRVSNHLQFWAYLLCFFSLKELSSPILATEINYQQITGPVRGEHAHRAKLCRSSSLQTEFNPLFFLSFCCQCVAWR